MSLQIVSNNIKKMIIRGMKYRRKKKTEKRNKRKIDGTKHQGQKRKTKHIYGK